MKLFFCTLTCLFLGFLSASAAPATPEAPATTAATPAPKKKPDPAFDKVTDIPGLPRVLLIGDSISIGYTVATQKLLAGKANVHRIPTNGGPTTTGTANLKAWLGTGKWDVIHFNWGLHDLKFKPDGQRQVSPEDYEKNLRALVSELKATGAKLIWCTTTPVPAGDLKPARKNEDVLAYNAIAKRVMDEQGVGTDDLYAFAAPQIEKIQLPVNVHFSPAGSKVLAEQVSRSILAVLPPAKNK